MATAGWRGTSLAASSTSSLTTMLAGDLEVDTRHFEPRTLVRRTDRASRLHPAAYSQPRARIKSCSRAHREQDCRVDGHVAATRGTDRAVTTRTVLPSSTRTTVRTGTSEPLNHILSQDEHVRRDHVDVTERECGEQSVHQGATMSRPRTARDRSGERCAMRTQAERRQPNSVACTDIEGTARQRATCRSEQRSKRSTRRSHRAPIGETEPSAYERRMCSPNRLDRSRRRHAIRERTDVAHDMI